MKKVPYSLLSGIMAIALFFAPFASSVTFAAEDSEDSVRAHVYDEDEYYKGYDNGFIYGKETGYDDGYNRGGYDDEIDVEAHLGKDVGITYTDGFQEGYKKGYRESYFNGREDGFKDIGYIAEHDYYEDMEYGDIIGFEEGFTDGYQGRDKREVFDFDEKFKQGYKEGFKQGYEAGYTIGVEVKENEVGDDANGDEDEDIVEDEVAPVLPGLDDEWDGRIEITTVTGEVYNAYELGEKQIEYHLDKNGNATFYNTNRVFMTEDAIKKIKKHATLITAQETKVKFPVNTLNLNCKVKCIIF